MFCNDLKSTRLKNRRMGNKKGFSLMEMMVVIAIIGILGAIAYPNLMKTRANFKTRAVASDIFSSFRSARIEAVKRNTSVCLIFTRATGNYLAFLNTAGDCICTAVGTADDCIANGTEPILFSKQVQPGTSIVADFSAGFNSKGRPLNNTLGNVTVQNNSNTKLQYKSVLSIAGRVDLQVSQDGGATWK